MHAGLDQTEAEMDTIKSLLYATIHRNKKSAAQLADEIGISYSYLCRAGLPTDESGVKFPTEYLVPLMKSAGDYSLLRHLAKLSGFLLIKPPRGFHTKMDESEAVTNYNTLCAVASNLMIEFFRSPSPEKMDAAVTSLHNVMEASASLQKQIINHNQTELPL